MRIALTDMAIRKLAPPAKGQLKVWDTKTPGFGIIVGKRTKTFTVVYGEDRRNQSIGRYPDISLSDARNEAKRLLSHKPTKNAAMSYSEALEAYLADCQTRLRPRTIEEYERPLRFHSVPKLTDIRADGITDPHHIMAFKVFYNWLLRRELVDANPFAYKKVVTTKRDRILIDDEIKAIWNYDREPISAIVKLLLLTGQRRNQIWKLQPDWIDGNYITFPAELMKSGEQHKIYIPNAALPFVEKAPFSFNSWSKSKGRIDKHTGVTGWTIHDLRRTFATIHARLGTPIHVIEAHLNHTTGTVSGVAAIYIRHNFLEQAKKPMETFADHIAMIVSK